MSQPYPNEQTDWQDYAAEVLKRYAAVGRDIDNDPDAFIWWSRPGYDIGAGMPKEQAFAKHLRELENALGIPRPKPPIGTEHGRLVRDGILIRDEDGQSWFGFGCDAFRLLEFWIVDQPKALRYLDWMQASGYYLGRVFCMYNGGIGRLIPSEIGITAYLQYGVDLLAECAKRGIRLKFEANADCQNPPLTFDPSWHILLTNAWGDWWNYWPSGGNEAPDNGWDPGVLAYPGMFSSRGSNLGDEAPPNNPWECGDLHPGRGPEWPRYCKMIVDVRNGEGSQPFHVPLGVDEGIGVGEQPKDGSTTNNPDDCFDFAAGVKLFGQYLFVHNRSGVIPLEPPGPIEQSCLDASREAVALMPLEAAQGKYTRGGLSDCPVWHDDAFALRTFFMLKGNKGYGVAIRPQPGWFDRVTGVNGWRIVEQRGPRRNIMLVER